MVTRPPGEALVPAGEDLEAAGEGLDAAGEEWVPTATPPAGVPLVRRRARGVAAAPDADDPGDAGPPGGSVVTEPATDEPRHRRRPATSAGPTEDGDDPGDGRLTRLGPVSPYRLRRRRHRLARRVRLALTLSVVVVLILIGFVAWYAAAAGGGQPGKRVLIHVAKGESMGAITTALTKHDIVSSGLGFRLSLFLHGTPNVVPGGYSLRQHQSFGAVRQELAAGPNVFLINVLPGFTISEVAKILSTSPGNLGPTFVKLATTGGVSSPFQSGPGTSLEGLLGPGRYELTPGETAKQLLAKMVQRFDQEAAAAGLTPASAQALGYTPYQVVTVASITQKEGYYQKYMGQVARVIYNRLSAGMPLAMTSTVLYALHQDGGKVTTADRTFTSPYNTYLNKGLTPTPICFPSPTALKAAASPPPGSWLYFDLVTQKKGVMVFSSTYQQQLAAQKQAAANAAKSGSG